MCMLFNINSVWFTFIIIIVFIGVLVSPVYLTTRYWRLQRMKNTKLPCFICGKSSYAALILKKYGWGMSKRVCLEHYKDAVLIINNDLEKVWVSFKNKLLKKM